MADNPPTWKLVKVYRVGETFLDTRPKLETLGFRIVGEDEHYYEVQPPEGWYRERNDYEMMVFDDATRMRMSQPVPHLTFW